MNESDLSGNALYYICVSFGLILIFVTLIFYMLETFFQYPSYMEEYGIWIGFEAFFLALLSMIVLVHRDKKMMN
jgi:hypothetical protein